MTQEKAQLDRRSFLRGSLAAAALVPLAGTLAACGGSAPSSGGGGGGGGTRSATNPFGLAKSSSVDTVIFNGGTGTCDGVRRFTAPVVANGRVIVGADGHLCSWSVH